MCTQPDGTGFSPMVTTKCSRSGTNSRISSIIFRASASSPVQKLTTTACGSFPSSSNRNRLILAFMAEAGDSWRRRVRRSRPN